MPFWIGWQHKKAGRHHGVYSEEHTIKELAERTADRLNETHGGLEFWVQDNPDLHCDCPFGSHRRDTEERNL